MFDEVYDKSLKELPNLCQGREEARIVCNRIIDLKPHLLMEIGTGEGGSHRLWMDAAPDGAEIILIDVEHFLSKVDFWRQWYKPNQKSVFFCDSLKRETRNRVLAYLQGRKLDFLFIDGDHHYESVKSDFEWYGSLVRVGGLICVHDTHFSRWPEFGDTVAEWWKEFAATHKTEEVFIEDHHDNTRGIMGTGMYVVE